MTPEILQRRFSEALPAGLDFASIRMVDERVEMLEVRDDVAQPPAMSRDVGAMVTVHHGGGIGYAATPDLSVEGIRAAFASAQRWARVSAERLVFDPRSVTMPAPRGRRGCNARAPWSEVPIGTRFDRLREACAAMAVDDRVVARSASVFAVDTDTIYLTSHGAEVMQSWRGLSPELDTTAHAGSETQRRTLGGLRGASRQGGAEILDDFRFDTEARRIAVEAVSLLDAPECPTGTMHLLLAPDQMMLQIHESIGHPIELDRILGDERNYAGTSFVTPDMFGSFRYSTELLDVSFDPGRPEQFASYGWDDDGEAAEKVLVIDKGILMRPLGGVISQSRAGMSGVACSRAASWNRAPIDRMANLNVEPGSSSFDDLVGQVERGVLMRTNRSWSIDDSRNQFQFGCEWGQEIVDGELGRVVRNPSYRGDSRSFWRGLVGVGDASTYAVLGTPFCGKGEPNQLARVGHASPACLFAGVGVFGGAA